MIRGLTVLLGLLAFALVPSARAEQLDLSVTSVDDIAFYSVVNTGPADIDIICQWQTNPGCNGRVDFTNKVEVGENIIVIGLFNKVYTGFCLIQPCGKYTGNFYLRLNGRVVWSQSLARRNNLRGIKGLWGVKVTVGGDGRMTVETALTSEERQVLDAVRRSVRF